MRVQALLLGIFFLSIVAAERPVFRRSYYDHHMGKHSVHPTTGRLSLHNRKEFANEKFIALDYEADLHDSDTINIDTHRHISKIQCMKGTLDVHFASPEAADYYENLWEHGTILTGGREWGCLDEEQGWPVHLLRRVEQVHRLGRKHIRVDTGRKITHTHAFRNLDLHFRTNAYQPGFLPNLKRKHAEPPRSNSKRQEDGDGISEDGSVLDSMYDSNSLIAGANAALEGLSAFQGALEAFEDALDIDFVSGEITFDLDAYDRTLPEAAADELGLQYNFNEGDKRADEIIPIGGVLECTDCYYFIVPVIDVVIRIVNFELKQLEVVIDGTLRVKLEVTLNLTNVFNESVLTGEQQFGDTIELPELNFSIGPVPVVIDPFMRVYLGTKADVVINSGFVAGFILNAYVQFGFVYNEDKREFVGNSQFFPPEAGIEFFSDEIDVEVLTYVEPRLFFRIDFTGGPFLAIRPYIQTIAQDASAYCEDLGANYMAGINLGVQVSVGAFVEIENPVDEDEPLFEQQWDPVVLFQIHKPVISSCIKFEIPNPLDEDPVIALPEFSGNPLLRGTSWTADEVVVKPGANCSLFQAPEIDIVSGRDWACEWTGTCQLESAAPDIQAMRDECAGETIQGDCEAKNLQEFFVSLTYEVTSANNSALQIECQATMTFFSDATVLADSALRLRFGRFLYPDNGVIVPQDTVQNGQVIRDETVECMGGFGSIPATDDLVGEFSDEFNELGLESFCFDFDAIGAFGETTLVVGLNSGAQISSWMSYFNTWLEWLM